MHAGEVPVAAVARIQNFLSANAAVPENFIIVAENGQFSIHVNRGLMNIQPQISGPGNSNWACSL